MRRKRVIALGAALLFMLSLLAGCQKQADSSEDAGTEMEDIRYPNSGA